MSKADILNQRVHFAEIAKAVAQFLLPFRNDALGKHRHGEICIFISKIVLGMTKGRDYLKENNIIIPHPNGIDHE